MLLHIKISKIVLALLACSSQVVNSILKINRMCSQNKNYWLIDNENKLFTSPVSLNKHISISIFNWKLTNAAFSPWPRKDQMTNLWLIKVYFFSEIPIPHPLPSAHPRPPSAQYTLHPPPHPGAQCLIYYFKVCPGGTAGKRNKTRQRNPVCVHC